MKKTENINYQHKEVLQRIILNVYYISIYLLCVSVMQGDTHATEYMEVRGPVAGTSSPTSTMWVPGMKLSSLQAWRQAPFYTEPSY